MPRSPLKIYIAGASRFPDLSQANLIKLVEFVDELGIREAIATPEFPLDDPGLSERSFATLELGNRRFTISSKVLYPGNGDGAHTAAAIDKSLAQTLANVETAKLSVLYCQGPDRATPLAEQAAAFDAAYQKGKFGGLGVCDFSVGLLEEWLRVADEHGFVKPSVFLGQYNLLCRTYEETLFPLLRKHGIKFVCSGVLAGGFLTGEKTLAPTAEALRETVGVDDVDWHAYDTPSMHDAMRKMAELCAAHDVGIRDAAFRWLVYHTVLDGGPVLSRDKGDALIVMPLSILEMARYAEAFNAGPLPDELAEGLSALWEGVKADAASLVP